MSADNNFKTSLESLFRGMDGFLTSKTVVGDAITVGDTIILPLVDVTFGVGAGTSSADKKNNSGGGMGGKITPSAILVIKDGHTKLVNIKNQDSVTKILDMVPDFVDRFAAGKKDMMSDEEVLKAAQAGTGEKSEESRSISDEKSHASIRERRGVGLFLYDRKLFARKT